MSAWYERQDLRQYVSTKKESAYGVKVAEADFDKEFRLSDEPIAEAIKRTPYNLCGGEFYSAFTDESRDTDLALRMMATPDATGWFLYYLMGGGSGYSVTGSADPYSHVFKPIQSPDYTPDSFSVVEGVKGGSEYWLYRGGMIPAGRLIGTVDGDKRLRCEGALEFAGQREAAVGFDPPECVGEQSYRFGDCVFSFGPYGGSAHSGLTSRAFTVAVDNKLETRDEAVRSGLYISARDRGDRSDGFRITYSVLGKKGDATDLNFHAGDYVFWQFTCEAPSTTDRTLLVRMNRGQILTKREGFSTSVNKSTHEFEILGFRDDTDATTIAQSPIYATIQTPTATYAA